ncbi:helix-turn-helix domain-containing protein [Bacillus sp. BGMRC 2118]|nr:helix-turn-helix domain-containing protein [Bacillus sp. BGMRC 2118]
MKQSNYLIGAFILGISIIISSFVLSNNFSNSETVVNTPESTSLVPDLMTKAQLSTYLQISEQSVENIIKNDDMEKANLSSYETYQFIPYLKIDNQERFLKEEIDKWLKYKNDNPLKHQ